MQNDTDYEAKYKTENAGWYIHFTFSILHSIYQGHGEGEFRLSIPAGDADILTMAAYNGLDDIQSQTPAVPVLGAGFIQLVEPVENQRQFLCRDGFAGVGDGDVGLISAFPDL